MNLGHCKGKWPGEGNTVQTIVKQVDASNRSLRPGMTSKPAPAFRTFGWPVIATGGGRRYTHRVAGVRDRQQRCCDDLCVSLNRTVVNSRDISAWLRFANP